MITRNFKLLAAGLLVASLSVLAQDSQKTLTNADVVKMVKGGLPESVVVSAIQSSPAKYDISPDALIALQKDGVTAKEMDAIIAGRVASGITFAVTIRIKYSCSPLGSAGP